MKKIKIQIELKDNWLTERQAEDIEILLGNIREKFEDAVFDKAVEKAVKELKIPKIKISKKALHQAVINRMADDIIENSK